MRVLEFIVEDQIITKSTSCDFENLVPGSQGYLQARFSFSPAWNGFVKAAAFWRGNKECEPQVLKDGQTCMISADALEGKSFGVSIVGKKGDTVMFTNRVIVNQNGGGIR